MESHFAENLVFSNHSNTVLYFFQLFEIIVQFGGDIFSTEYVSNNFPDLLIVLLPDPHSLWQLIWHLGWG